METGEDRPTDRELAQAMREGLERRRSFDARPLTCRPSPGLNSDFQQALGRHVNLLAVPPLAKPGPLAWLARFVRGCGKTIMRPWLAIQSEFNRLTFDALEAAHQDIGRLQRRLDARIEQLDRHQPELLEDLPEEDT